MDELSFDDVSQMYVESVVVYNGKLIYVEDLSREEGGQLYLLVRYLEDQKRDQIKFNRVDFKPPNRIGYVNHGRSAWFIARTPGRVFKVGLSNDNIRITPTQGFERSPTVRITSEGLQAAHDNQYPSLYKAWCSVKGEAGYANACKAFDHQFAICSNRNIYYKGLKVGSIPKGNVRKSNIVWNVGYEYLADVMEPDYEKTVRTFG